MPDFIISPQTVRRLAITRQRLAGAKSEATKNQMLDVIRDIGCVQIDPIRAVERTQYLVLWSRLGHYDTAHLDSLLWEDRALFEYWAHAASIVLTENYPIHQYQMRRAAMPDNRPHMHTWLEENSAFREYVMDHLNDYGPVGTDSIEDRSVTDWNSSGWTNARNVSEMFGFLWDLGDITVAGRKGLRKQWATTDRWLPDHVLQKSLEDREVVYQAAQISLRALGTGTAKHIENHFIRNHYPDLGDVLTQLEQDGKIIQAGIEDETCRWPETWYIHSDDVPLAQSIEKGEAWSPQTVLLSPFDNLICDRTRTERLWQFRFRIEIYVPKSKRQFGYYVLPILHGDRLIGRIDSSMDRKTDIYHVNRIFAEDNAPLDRDTGHAIAGTVADLGTFLGAKTIKYGKSIPEEWRMAMR